MIRVNIRVDAPSIEGKVTEATQKAQFALDQQVLKDSNFYIPKDTGEVERSGIRFSRPGDGYVFADDTVFASFATVTVSFSSALSAFVFPSFL